MREVSGIALGRSVRLSNFVPFNLPAIAPSLVLNAKNGGAEHGGSVGGMPAAGASASSASAAFGANSEANKNMQRYTLVCKRYASLSFIACVESVEDNAHLDDIIRQQMAGSGGASGAPSAGLKFSPGENELLTLEIIHYFVEALDKYFGNVCELDLIYHFQKAYMVLDEVILGGELQETSKRTILKYVQLHEQLMEEESGQGAASGGGPTSYIATVAAAAGVTL